LIVAKALHYLDDLSRESQGDAGLERELASAFERVGDVQGYSLNANLGDSAGALASYEKAVSIRSALHSADPDRLDDAINLSKSLRITAQAMLLNGKTIEAWKTAHRSAEIAEKAEQSHPNDKQLLVELGQDYSAEADILGGNFTISNLGNTSDAIAVRQKQASVQEQLLKLDPGNAAIQRNFGVSLAKTGDEFVLVGEWHSALAQFTQAEAIFEKLAGPAPSRKALDAVHSIDTRLYFAQRAIGNEQGGLEMARRALEIAKKLSAADANDVRAHVSLTIDYANLAAVCLSMHQMRTALDASNTAVRSIDNLVRLNPSDGELPGIRAAVYTTEGDVLSGSSSKDKWLEYFRTAIGIYRQIKSSDPDNVEDQLQLSGEYNDFGKALLQNGAFDRALEAFQDSLASSAALIHSVHPSVNSLYTVAESYTGLGDVEAAMASSASQESVRLAALKRAQGWYAQSLKLWSQVKDPGFLTPSGDDCIPPSAVRQRLARVNSKLNDRKH
jgi:tetratricopeptide (TPR) repeat protein